MIHGKEFKLLTDLTDFINRNSIPKEDIIVIGSENESYGVRLPNLYYIVFYSEKEDGNFTEPPPKLTF